MVTMMPWKKILLYALIPFALIMAYVMFTSRDATKYSADSVGIDTVNTGPEFRKDSGNIALPDNMAPVLDTLSGHVATGSVNPDALVGFAETLVGTPYCYASTDPGRGFDCSGFINYVFNHFNIKVPRSSRDFTNLGTEVKIPEAKRGDIILFTGTDSAERFVGHIGIVVDNKDGTLHFIHSSSGKAHGVVVTRLDSYYMGRFMKVIRVFHSMDGRPQVVYN